MAKAQEIEGIAPDMTFGSAGARIVAARAKEVFAHADGVLDTEDIERVHDMRVATRRLRAALEIFRGCFEKREFKDALRAVKELADALGERRDRDVAIESLADFETALARPDRPGVASLIAELRTEQRAANEELEAHVADARLSLLRERITRLCEPLE